MQSGLFRLGATLALIGTVMGRVNPTTAAQQTTSTPTTIRASDAADDSSPRKTANDLLKALRRSRPIRELIPPADGPDTVSTSQPRSLLPEGTAVINWEGTPTKDGAWWTITPESPTGEPTTKILPNINLEVISRSLAGKSTPVRFSISGEMTAFQGENFLLIRFVRRIIEAPDPAPLNQPNATSGAAGSNPDDHEAPPPSPEDVIDMLHNQKPRSVVAAAAPTRRARRTADLPGPSVRPDGAAFAQRPGRITRDEQWWGFSFETEHSDPEEPMIKLLPSRGLELMIRSADQTRDGLVLLVSGELTQFRGQNYLLPRGVIRRTGTDNLRK